MVAVFILWFERGIYSIVCGCNAAVNEDDASPEHASSADVGAPATTHAGPPGDAWPPSDAASSDASGKQARNTY